MPNGMSSHAVLLQAKLEYRLKMPLSDHEAQLLSQVSDKTIERLNVNNKRPQDSIKAWIDCHNDQSLTGSLSVFVSRWLGIWSFCFICQFLFFSLLSPNMFRREIHYRYILAYLLIGLPFLCRFNDQCIHHLKASYSRMSDLTSMSVGDALESMTKRYLFFLMALSALGCVLSRYFSHSNHFLIFDFLLFGAMLLNLMPVMVQEILMLCSADTVSIENSLIIRVLGDAIRSVVGVYLLARRACHCLSTGQSLYNLAKVKFHTANQAWRFGEFCVHAAGTLPSCVSHQQLRHAFFPDGLDGEQASWPRLSKAKILMNSLDGRAWFALINCYHAQYFMRDVYSFDQKDMLVKRGIALLSDRPDFIPLIYRSVFSSAFTDDVRLVQFVLSFMQAINKDDRLRYRLITCFDFLSTHKSLPSLVDNFIGHFLRSDLMDECSSLLKDRVSRFNDPDFCHTTLAMLLVRDFSKRVVLCNGGFSTQFESLYVIAQIFDSLAAVSWSENDAAQSVISQVFRGLSQYFSDPTQKDVQGRSLCYAFGLLAALSDDDCYEGSAPFYWSVFDFLNVICHSSGVVDGVSTDAFKHFLASQLFVRLEVRELAFMRQVIGCHDVKKNQVELMIDFLDIVSSALRYDLLGCLKGSFENSVELNDFLRLRSSSSAQADAASYVNLSSDFLSNILRFLDQIDRVETAHKKFPSEDKKQETSLKDRDRSTIYCLALLFEYFGSGRIYGADLLARLMYSNVLNNPGYVRWSLMIVDFFVSGTALIKSPFYLQERKRFPFYFKRCGYSFYYSVSRSIFHIPRFVFFVIQLLFVVIGTILYNLGREQVLVLFGSCLGAMAFVHACGLPPLFVPVMACIFFYGCRFLVDAIEPYIRKPFESEYDPVREDSTDHLSSEDFGPRSEDSFQGSRSSYTSAASDASSVSYASAESSFFHIPT